MNDIQPSRRRPEDVRPALNRPQTPQRPGYGRVPARPVQTTPGVTQPADVLPLPPLELKEPSSSLEVKPQKRRFSRKKWLLGIILSLLVIAVVSLLGAYAWYQQGLQAVQPGSDEMVKVTINPGSDPEDIAKTLKKSQLIRSEAAFNLYVRIKGESGLLQAGAYRLGKGEDVPTIVKHLTSGTTDTFSVTFLPGATLADHRKVLIDAGYSATDVDAAFAKSYNNSILFDGKPADADLEGYIYGETYNFAANATPEEILTYIFDYFAQVVEKENLIKRYEEKNMTLYEGITFASIIQREERDANNQRRVSQVFNLRLASNMPLGSDPTYQYAADKQGAPRDPGLESPYNTRLVKGLPPGPIASPGVTALIAVVEPSEGDYLYFLSGDDDQLYFGRTLEEHERNIRDHCQKKCQII